MKTILNIGVAMSLAMLLLSCDAKEEQKEEIDTPVNVVVSQAGLISVMQTLHYAGQVISNDQTVLSTKLLGQVRSVHVKAGDQVAKGMLLVTIDSKEVRAQLAAAQAGLLEAQAAQRMSQKNHDRISSLQAKGSATQQELDQVVTTGEMAGAKVASASQQVTRLQELLTYAEVRAPIDGFVSNKYVNPGDMASPGSPLVVLESMQKMKMEITVPENEIGLFNEADKVVIRLDAFPDQSFNGQVDKIIPSSAFTGSQFKISIQMPEAAQSIKPGMHGEVIHFGPAIDKLVMPSEALIHRGQLVGVYAINDKNEVMLRWLRLGRNTDMGFEVLSGLDRGERFVVSSEARILEGTKVKISKSI